MGCIFVNGFFAVRKGVAQWFFVSLCIEEGEEHEGDWRKEIRGGRWRILAHFSLGPM